MAGGQHHHRTNLDKYHPGYFGKARAGPTLLQYHTLTATRSACDISTKRTSSSGSQLSILTRSALPEWQRIFGGAGLTRTLQLWSLVPLETRDAYLEGKKSDTAPVLDLLPLGYSKVLGKGRIPEIPLVVRARYFSKEAEKKIKEAGGVVELVA